MSLYSDYARFSYHMPLFRAMIDTNLLDSFNDATVD